MYTDPATHTYIEETGGANILFVTGMQNIRDVIPFPRTPKNAEF